MNLSKKKIFIFLVIIMLVACFFRLYQLDSLPPGLYHDEAMNGNNALESLETGEFKWFYPENNGREGLYIHEVAFALKIFGNKAWALRLVSALYGILGVLGLFYLSRELFKNNSIALFSSFFLATSFWHTLFSRIGFRAIMAPFFLTWALAFLFMAERKKSLLYALWAGLFFGLGFHSYIAYRIAPLILIVPFWLLWKKGQKKTIAVFLLATFMAGIPLGLYFIENPQDFLGRTSQISIFSSESPILNVLVNTAKTIGMFFFYGDWNWRHNLAGSPQLWWPVAILSLFGLTESARQILQQKVRPRSKQKINKKKELSNKYGYILLFVWLVVMTLPVIISNEGIPHALRAIILIPPVFIFAGIGLNLLVQKIKQVIKQQAKKNPSRQKQLARIQKELFFFLLIFLTMVGIHGASKYFIHWGQNVNTYHSFNGRYWEIGEYLNQSSPEIKKYIIVNADGVLAKGIPMPAQTIMFATNTYTKQGQSAKNITYLLPGEIDQIDCPEGRCEVVTMKMDGYLRQKIKEKYSCLQLRIEEPGIEVLKK